MKKILILAVLNVLISAQTVFAQQKPVVQLAKTGAAISNFVPKNYKVLQTATGDLNKDGRPDVAVVMENKEKHRILFLLFANENKTYTLKAQNEKIIMHADEGGMLGDPFGVGSLDITKNVLTISFEGGGSGRWNLSYKFRFKNNDFQLIGATSTNTSPQSEDIETYDFNFSTQKMQHTKGKMDSDKNDIEKWTKINIPMKTLKTMQHPYDWEIMKGVFI